MLRHCIAGLFAAVALATPIEERNMNCNVVDAVVSIMHAQNIATPFCSSLLSIPTITQTSTVTSSPPCQTTTTSVGSAATITTVSTSVVYGVTTVYPVVAVSTTSTCALGATVVPVAQKQKRNVRTTCTSSKPQTTTAIGTPTCLSKFGGSSLTSACSCLSIPTPTSVSITTTTLPVQTITKQVANSASVTITSVITSTSFTSTYSGTQFYTSTYTILPAPTSVQTLPDGETYGIYGDLDFPGQDIQNFFCYAGGPSAPPPFTGTSCASFSDCVAECGYYNDNNLGASTGTTCGTVVYNAAPDGSSASCYLKTGETGCGSTNNQTTAAVLLPLIANDVQ